MKAVGSSALIIALICTAIPAWAESSGSDFEHEEELLQSAQGTLLRVRIAPTMDILEQRLASSLQTVDITSHASSRTLRTLSSGETKVACRANGPVIFDGANGRNVWDYKAHASFGSLIVSEMSLNCVYGQQQQQF